MAGQARGAHALQDGREETKDTLATAVRAALGTGDTRRAVDKAKALCARDASEESEGLLAEAYSARILSLGGGAADADALLEVARTRCPSARATFDRLSPRLDARFARIEALLRHTR